MSLPNILLAAILAVTASFLVATAPPLRAEEVCANITLDPLPEDIKERMKDPRAWA